MRSGEPWLWMIGVDCNLSECEIDPERGIKNNLKGQVNLLSQIFPFLFPVLVLLDHFRLAVCISVRFSGCLFDCSPNCLSLFLCCLCSLSVCLRVWLCVYRCVSACIHACPCVSLHLFKAEDCKSCLSGLPENVYLLFYKSQYVDLFRWCYNKFWQSLEYL